MRIIKQSSGILVLHSDNESNAKKIHHSQPTELTVYFNMIIIWFPLTLNHEYYKMLLRLRNLFLRKKKKVRRYAIRGIEEIILVTYHVD